MRISKWLLAGLLLTTGGTQQVYGSFRSHLSTPTTTTDNTIIVASTPVSGATSVSVSTLISNVVTDINKEETITATQAPKQKTGKTNKLGSTVLREDPDSSSSSSEPIQEDPLLNEDADVLATQENLSVGAMSSDGLDVKQTTASSSSSNSPPPPKVPAMANALLKQAQQKQTIQPSQQRTLKAIQRRTYLPVFTQTPIKTTTTTTTRGVASVTPIVDREEDEPDTDTDTDDTETETHTEPEITMMSRTISMSPFIRLSIATGRQSITPRMIRYNPLQEMIDEIRASLHTQDSMWRQSSSHGISQIMRVYPIESNAEIHVLHIHAEPSITQHPCRQDAKQYCASEMISHSILDTMVCLNQHVMDVSDTCRYEIQHCPIMACAQDIQTLCTIQQRMTRTGVMECLAQKQQQLSQTCQTATGTHTDNTNNNITPVTSAETNAIETTSSPISRTSMTFGSWISSASPTSSTSVSASVIVGLTFLGFVLIVLSCFLYYHLRKITNQPEQMNMETIPSA